jgi:hypothetical protein
MKGAILSLLLLLVAFQVNASLYGTVFTSSGDLNYIETVEISPEGNFTTIAQNFVSVGGMLSMTGISSFDEKNKIMYFVTDFEAPFVYGVDVVTGSILPPMFIFLLSISHIVADPVGQQLLITGLYSNHTYAITSVPYHGGVAKEVFNSTLHNVKHPRVSTLDSENGSYYISYLGHDGKEYLGQFNVEKPEAFKATPYPCQGHLPYHLAYDPFIGGLVGYSFSNLGGINYYFEIVDEKCTVTEIPLHGIPSTATYDPTTGQMYLSYNNKSGSFLGIYNNKNKSFSSVSTASSIFNLGVSYKA